jgi:hypothetical protein
MTHTHAHTYAHVQTNEQENESSRQKCCLPHQNTKKNYVV